MCEWVQVSVSFDLHFSKTNLWNLWSHQQELVLLNHFFYLFIRESSDHSVKVWKHSLRIPYVFS